MARDEIAMTSFPSRVGGILQSKPVICAKASENGPRRGHFRGSKVDAPGVAHNRQSSKPMERGRYNTKSGQIMHAATAPSWISTNGMMPR